LLVQRITPEFIEAARPARHAPGNRWFVDETYLKVAGNWTYLYWAVDEHGQVIDRPDGRAALPQPSAAHRRHPGRGHHRPRSCLPEGPRRADPPALHTVEQYANNPVEADHGRLKARLRPMRA